MQVSEALHKRRSIKYFDPDHRITDAETRSLLEHTLLSPTAFNLQNWRIVNVQNPALRQQIRAAAWDQPQMTDASLLLVFCMDNKAWQKDPARYWQNAPADKREIIVSAINDFYHNDPVVERDEGIRSCSLAAMSTMLFAQELGYDSCPMDGFDFAQVGEIINLPQDHEICLIVAIGKAITPAWPRNQQLGLDEIVFNDQF